MVHARQSVPDKYMRLAKDMYHQCETVVTSAEGTSEPFAVEVGLHQGYAFSPFLFAIMMDSLTENIRKEALWQMMFAVDVVLCAKEKDVKWREALEKRVMKVSRAKTECMCLNGKHFLVCKIQCRISQNPSLLNLCVH